MLCDVILVALVSKVPRLSPHRNCSTPRRPPDLSGGFRDYYKGLVTSNIDEKQVDFTTSCLAFHTRHMELCVPATSRQYPIVSQMSIPLRYALYVPLQVPVPDVTLERLNIAPLLSWTNIFSHYRR